MKKSAHFSIKLNHLFKKISHCTAITSACVGFFNHLSFSHNLVKEAITCVHVCSCFVPLLFSWSTIFWGSSDVAFRNCRVKSGVRNSSRSPNFSNVQSLFSTSLHIVAAFNHWIKGDSGRFFDTVSIAV